MHPPDREPWEPCRLESSLEFAHTGVEVVTVWMCFRVTPLYNSNGDSVASAEIWADSTTNHLLKIN